MHQCPLAPMECSETSHQDVTHNREATGGSLPRAWLSKTFPRCDCIRLYLPSREPISPAILSVCSLMWCGAWCGSFGFRSCGGQHSSLTRLLFDNQVEMPALDSWSLVVSVSDAIRLAPHTVHFCAVLVSFLDHHHGQCAERAVASAILPCLRGGLYQLGFVAAGDTIIYTFVLWLDSRTSAPSRN